jgi:hypothetical protein
MAVRLRSTLESVDKGEVSILAILETLAAVSLVFHLSSRSIGLEWLAVAICVAPLLLLRTEKSTSLGVRYWQAGREKLDFLESRIDDLNKKSVMLPVGRQLRLKLSWTGWLLNFRTDIVFLSLLAILVVAVRFTATLVSALANPIGAIRAVPQNWARFAISTDSFFPIEPVPGESSFFSSGFWSFAKRRYEQMTDGQQTAAKILLLPELLFILLVYFLPALFYRWSLKATTIIYAPFVFIAHQTFTDAPNLRDELRIRKASSVTNLSVLVGVVFILGFLLKLAFIREAGTFVGWWNSKEVDEFVALYVAPAEIPKWQLSSLLNSGIAIAVFFFVREALVRVENNQPWPEHAVQRILGFTFSVRVLLTLYTILCTAYITLRAARDWNLPAIAEKWFPWQ